MATARSSPVTSRSGSRAPTWSAKRSVTRPGSRMRSGRTFAGAPTGARVCGAVRVDASGCRRPPPLSPVQSSPPASGTGASTRPPKVIAPTLDRQLDCQLPRRHCLLLALLAGHPSVSVHRILLNRWRSQFALNGPGVPRRRHPASCSEPSKPSRESLAPYPPRYGQPSSTQMCAPSGNAPSPACPGG